MTLDQIEERGAKSAGRLRHLFFALPEFQIQEALKAFDPFPEELKIFYTEIGFGFMYREKSGKFNMLFDPMTLIYTNRQVNYFATPEVTEEQKYYDKEKQLLFFKTMSNNYLAIDRQTVNSKNKIYYRGAAIGYSLKDFIKRFYFNSYFVDMAIDISDDKQKRERDKALKEQRKSLENKKVKYLGGHILIDPD